MLRSAVRPPRWLVAAAAGLLAAGPAAAFPDFLQNGRNRVADLNRTLGGRVLDFTHNHGADRRLYSPALGEGRDLYVYLPPGYDDKTPFPAMVWLHGVSQDERNFLDVVGMLDREIRAGALPPLVIAAPDGSIRGRSLRLAGGSFYVNSRVGRFEDYIAQDVWGFVTRNYAVRPERDAHVLAGVSMGGFGAYNLGFKHRTEFGQLVGVLPPLDLRYADCHGRYFSDYDPDCFQYRDPLPRRQVVGKFFGGLVRVRSGQLFGPLVGPGHDLTAFVAGENPVEMLSAYDVRPGEFGMFIGYGTKDEFNVDAEDEHFLDVARRRGIFPDVVVIPGGRHDYRTGMRLFPPFAKWLTGRLAAYVPAGYDPGGRCPACVPKCAVRRVPVPFPAAASTLP